MSVPRVTYVEDVEGIHWEYNGEEGEPQENLRYAMDDFALYLRDNSADLPASPWDSSGKLKTNFLPDLGVVQYKGHKADQAAMLATVGEQGDWIIRDDDNTVWMITAQNPALLGSWTKWPTAANPDPVSAVQIVDGCYGTPGTSSINATGTYEAFHTVGVDASDIQVGYGNWTNGGASGFPHVDVDPGTSVTFSAALRDAAGNVYGLTFQGRKTVVLDSGGFVLSDPLPINVLKGEVIYTRTYISAGQARWNRTINGSGTYPTSPGGFVATDQTASAAPGASLVTAGFKAAWDAMCILGVPTNKVAVPKSVIIQGDSIAWGAFDGSQGGNFIGHNAAFPLLASGGYLHRALAGQAGVINVAMPGDNQQWHLDGAGHFRRGSLIKFARYAVDEYGFGDLYTRTPVQLQTDLLTQAKRNLAKGILGNIIITLTPAATTTDRFATVGNQTVVNPHQATRIVHNAWVRDGGPIDPTTKLPVATGTVNALRFGAFGHPIKGYLEVADALESARDSGKFKAANRVVTDGAATAATATVTSATAAFTSADLGRAVTISGVGAAGADLTTTILAVNSATSIAIDTAITTTVTNATLVIGVWTYDGVHPSIIGHKAVADAITAPLLALTS